MMSTHDGIYNVDGNTQVKEAVKVEDQDRLCTHKS